MEDGCETKQKKQQNQSFSSDAGGLPGLRLGLRATGLAVERGGRPVVGGVSFTLEPGHALVLTGPNGAGKTTLIRALAGLLPFAGGGVAVEGADEGRGGEVRLSELCHYVGHANAAKGELTVAENLGFWARFMGANASRDGAARALFGVDVAMAALGLNGLGDIPVRYLSAGQQRRVALARLLVAERPVWLLDEPTSSLDAVNSERLVKIGNDHLARGGMILAATHLPLALAPRQELRLEPVDAFGGSGADLQGPLHAGVPQ